MYPGRAVLPRSARPSPLPEDGSPAAAAEGWDRSSFVARQSWPSSLSSHAMRWAPGIPAVAAAARHGRRAAGLGPIAGGIAVGEGSSGRSRQGERRDETGARPTLASPPGPPLHALPASLQRGSGESGTALRDPLSPL